MIKNKVLMFATLIILISCKKVGCTDPCALNYDSSATKDNGNCEYSATSYSSEMSIIPYANSFDIVYDTIMYQHPLGYDFSVATLKFFISDLKLYMDNGDSLVLQGAHYFNSKEGPTSIEIWNQEIPDGVFTGLGFDFGLNENYNYSGLFTNPPESLMEWPIPMGGGYHYMKFEGKFDSLGTIKNFNLHTGALNGIPYYFHVSLDHNFIINDGNINIQLKMNLENWLQQPNIFDFNVFGSAIMGNSTAQMALMENGIDVFSIIDIN